MRARVLLLVTIALALLAAAPAHAAKQVTYSELLAQVKSGPLIRAIINRKRGDIEIKFRDLSEWEAFYPPGAQHTLQRLLRERHVRVIFASRHVVKHKPAPVHHKLRYIAAGVLGALALAGVVYLLARRRRTPPPVREGPAASP
ncbi:MAG TPA: hypothetical protein VNZ05_00615 [Solirubrobacteraceae bacterium]|nr:hypothetical protein [Solirubrobacteraceae bacterium]